MKMISEGAATVEALQLKVAESRSILVRVSEVTVHVQFVWACTCIVCGHTYLTLQPAGKRHSSLSPSLALHEDINASLQHELHARNPHVQMFKAAQLYTENRKANFVLTNPTGISMR